MEVKLPIKEELKEIKYMSYFYSGKLLNEIIAIFLKFSNGYWYKVVVSDGKSTFEAHEDPKSIGISNDEEVYYPIQSYKKIDMSILGELEIVEEYLWQGKEDESCGLALIFKNGTCLNITEREDSMHLSTNDGNVQSSWSKKQWAEEL